VYTATEAAYGSEALINIRYSNSKTGIIKYYLADSFIIQTNSNWFDLFDTAHDMIIYYQIFPH
jgi:hypothetical protein